MNEVRVYKFFPLATSRLGSLYEYINRMYEKDYKIVDIVLDCILVFEKSRRKEGYTYFILTEQYRRDGRKEKWNDIKFLEDRIPNFYNTNGEQIKKLVAFADVLFYIYLSKNISKSEYQEVCDIRKKYIRRANICRSIILFIILILYPMLLIYRYLR